MSVSDFHKQFVFYRQYHHNAFNKWIHIFSVPLIALTALALFSAIPFASPALVLVYFLYYLRLYPPVAFHMLLFLSCMCALAFQLRRHLEIGTIVAIHVVAWLMQFIGHGVFEKRAPALMENLVQGLHDDSTLILRHRVAFLLAPVFVFLEVLFAIGFNRKLQHTLEKLTAEQRPRFLQNHDTKLGK